MRTLSSYTYRACAGDATRQKILALENDQLRRIAITRFAASLTPCFSYAQRLQRYTELCEDMNAIGNESERATGLKDLLAYAPGLRYASVHTRIGEMAQAIGDDALRTSLEDALVKYAPPA